MRRERDVRRFRRVHIVRGIRLAGKSDVCAPPVTYRTVLRLFSLFILPRVMEANITSDYCFRIRIDSNK